MKYYLLFISAIILLSFSSCGQKKKDLSIEAEAELNELAKKKGLDYGNNDSQNQEGLGNIDSLSLIAWGDTKFGMSKKEVIASEAFKREKEEKNMEMDFGDYYSTGPQKGILLSRLYGLNVSPEIRAHFQEDELYLITIETFERSADKIEDLANDCGIFTKEFIKKYGEPDYLKTNVSILDFKNHKLPISSFIIGNKKIWIGLIENDLKYKYYISISNKTFPRKKHIPTDEEIRKQKEQEIKNKELRDNSF